MIDARTATPAETLEQRIMDPCAAKSEAEWWAHREIAKQRAENERLLQALGLVTTAVPDMEIDIENPVGMAQRVVAEVERLRAEVQRQTRHVEQLYDQIRRRADERDKAQIEVKRLRAEIERLRADNERLFNEDTKTRHALKGWVFVCPDGGDEPTHERVAAVVAEVERLREALVLGSEVLASHQGSPQREWHSGGAWLYPGDSINVVRAPLPEIKVEP